MFDKQKKFIDDIYILPQNVDIICCRSNHHSGSADDQQDEKKNKRTEKRQNIVDEIYISHSTDSRDAWHHEKEFCDFFWSISFMLFSAQNISNMNLWFSMVNNIVSRDREHYMRLQHSSHSTYFNQIYSHGEFTSMMKYCPALETTQNDREQSTMN